MHLQGEQSPRPNARRSRRLGRFSAIDGHSWRAPEQGDQVRVRLRTGPTGQLPLLGNPRPQVLARTSRSNLTRAEKEVAEELLRRPHLLQELRGQLYPQLDQPVRTVRAPALSHAGSRHEHIPRGQVPMRVLIRSPSSRTAGDLGLAGRSFSQLGFVAAPDVAEAELALGVVDRRSPKSSPKPTHTRQPSA
jgi:hypothetical protein